MIALGFFPPLFGGAVMVWAAMAEKRREKLATAALAVSISATVIGTGVGAVIGMQGAGL